MCILTYIQTFAKYNRFRIVVDVAAAVAAISNVVVVLAMFST